jgi:hypothetical protein
MPASVTISLMFEPTWDAWRTSPDFRELIAKLGVTEEYQTARETRARMQREQAGKK